MSKRVFPALAAILAAVFAAGPAPAQRPDPILQLQGDVITLQGLIKDLQRSTDTRTQTLQALVERVADRVNLMGGEIQAIQSGALNNAQSSQANIEKIARLLEENRAQSEKTNREFAAALHTLNADMTALNNRLGERLTTSLNDKTKELTDKVGQNISGMQLQIDALSKQVAKLSEQPQSAPLPSCEQVLRNAGADYNLGMYDLTLDGIQEILARCPNHPAAATAELLRADTFFAQRNWSEAVSAYDSVLQKSKDQDTKTHALLKKGLSLVSLKINADATKVFQQIVAEFPDEPEATRAREELKKLNPTPAATPARGGTSPQRGG
jgi:TolA-binding protein